MGKMVRCWRGMKRSVPEDGMEEERQFMTNAKILLKELKALTNGRGPRGVPIRCFPKREIEDATDNFSAKRVYEEGFFDLYKGYLRDRIVLVKKYKKRIENEHCIKDIVFASRMSVHEHVLKFLGCCLETELPALVFEYAEKRNLHDCIHSRSEALARALLWKERVKIAADVASAVTYLHTAFPRPVVHRDLKPSNILVDGVYNAKLIDFSLSAAVPENESLISTERIAGTLGFLAPECFINNAFNEKADVYSFGVIMFELLSGKTVRDISTETYIGGEEATLESYLMQCTDMKRHIDLIAPKILAEGTWPQKEQQLETFAKLALQCVRLREDERPTMAQVEEQLREMYAETLNSTEYSVGDNEMEEKMGFN